ncbi:hypothetical protein [Asticcacaulis sp. YBE204]|uniref:hypothetical protein n=1 Tax=Asticcacaulis sp. YBE204 TaxID=1282363 RepID=UPI0003C3FE65|nr:hypothetical protein [Asticcacaulis sp. YBE204]ESQ81044.1 hypothetical protein AEYBE204_01580 [Asticcacaulis sp. YBE204]
MKFGVLAIGILAVLAGSVGAATPPDVPYGYLEEVKAPPRAKVAPSVFRLGALTYRFEQTPLIDLAKATGHKRIGHKGDASEALDWLCFTIKAPQPYRLWLSSSEMGGGTVDGVDMRAEAATATEDCPILAARLTPVSVDGVRIGMTQAEVRKALGAPSDQRDGWWIYTYEKNVRPSDPGYFFTAYGHMMLHFEDGRLTQISAVRVTSN